MQWVIYYSHDKGFSLLSKIEVDNGNLDDLAGKEAILCISFLADDYAIATQIFDRFDRFAMDEEVC
jgi:hypothetical protein